MRANLFFLTPEDLLPAVTDDEFAKHLGPGPHPDGSPQAVHGRKRGKRLERDLADKGGFTYQPFLLGSPTKGLAVSPYPDRERVIPYDEVTPEVINEYLDEHWEFVKADPNRHFGAWVDEENVYLDVSVVYEDAEEARRVGQAFNQLAFWDLAAGKEVRL